MPLRPPSSPRPSPQPRRARAVLSVGRRLFINCPGVPRSVALTDDAGRSISALADGAEVEIVAWRPRGGSGTRYRVRSTRDRCEGWLAAEELRPALTPAPPAASDSVPRGEAPIATREDVPRKFGQRR